MFCRDEGGATFTAAAHDELAGSSGLRFAAPAAGGGCTGPPGTTLAVVDPGCRVHGFDGPGVVDASAMPRDCGANTALTTIMVAEMTARLR